MKLLLTGGAGKVGQWVARELLDHKIYEITVLDRTPGPERGAVKYLIGDIQDFGQVIEAMAGSEAVIHLAAIHNPNIATTSTTYQTNVVGTFNSIMPLSVWGSSGLSRQAVMPSSVGVIASASSLTTFPSMKIIRCGLWMSTGFQRRSVKPSRNHTRARVWKP
jgi:nucleoside-diphosphate-sugar epimerase